MILLEMCEAIVILAVTCLILVLVAYACKATWTEFRDL